MYEFYMICVIFSRFTCICWKQ